MPYDYDLNKFKDKLNNEVMPFYSCRIQANSDDNASESIC